MRRSLTAVFCMFVFVCFMSVSAVPRGALAAGPVPGWGDSLMIEVLNSADADYPFIAADASGNAFAVWDQYDGSRTTVFANRYVAGVGWTGAMMIDSAGTDNCYNPRVAFDGSGNAIAVWQRSVSSINSVWANRYVPGEGWGTAEPIESQADEAGLPQVVVDESGNATAIWEMYKDGHGHVWSNRYVVGEGWGVEEEAEQYTEDAYSFDIALDDAGSVVAVWCQFDGSIVNVSANRYVPGEGWDTAVTIGGNATGGASEPKVAVDPSGNATAVWYQFDFDDLVYSIWSNRYVAGEGWGPAVLLEHDDLTDASAVRVACDGSGNALAVWQQDDAGVVSIWSNLYVPGEGWGAPGTVEDSDLFANAPKVVFDGSGNATAVWQQWDGDRNTISSSRYLAGEGWGDMELASTTGTESSMGVVAAIDGLGNVFAAWLQFGGFYYNIWANVYTCPDTTPPRVSIESPEDGLTTETSAVTVSGTTEPGVSLSVNGMSALVEADGSFACVVVLVDGTNTITATAVDLWSNSANASIVVTYVDPVAALEDQLATALDDLAALQDELDSALTDIEVLQVALDDSEADVATLQAQLDTALLLLTSLEAQLDAAEADLADAQVELEAAEGDLESLQTQLDNALVNLTVAEDELANALDDLAAVQIELDAAEDELSGANGDLDCASSLNLLLMAGLVVAAVVAAVLAVMFLRLRGRDGQSA